MSKFVVTYNAPAEAVEMMHNMTPEQAQEGMKPWMAWMEKCGSALVDMGAPLGNSQTVTKSGTAAGGSEVSGYSILEADNMSAALELLKGHPHLSWADGCSIEVHEAMPLPM